MKGPLLPLFLLALIGSVATSLDVRAGRLNHKYFIAMPEYIDIRSEINGNVATTVITERFNGSDIQNTQPVYTHGMHPRQTATSVRWKDARGWHDTQRDLNDADSALSRFIAQGTGVAVAYYGIDVYTAARENFVFVELRDIDRTSASIEVVLEIAEVLPVINSTISYTPYYLPGRPQYGAKPYLDSWSLKIDHPMGIVEVKSSVFDNVSQRALPMSAVRLSKSNRDVINTLAVNASVQVILDWSPDDVLLQRFLERDGSIVSAVIAPSFRHMGVKTQQNRRFYFIIDKRHWLCNEYATAAFSALTAEDSIQVAVYKDGVYHELSERMLPATLSIRDSMLQLISARGIAGSEKEGTPWFQPIWHLNRVCTSISRGTNVVIMSQTSIGRDLTTLESPSRIIREKDIRLFACGTTDQSGHWRQQTLFSDYKGTVEYDEHYKLEEVKNRIGRMIREITAVPVMDYDRSSLQAYDPFGVIVDYGETSLDVHPIFFLRRRDPALPLRLLVKTSDGTQDITVPLQEAAVRLSGEVIERTWYLQRTIELETRVDDTSIIASEQRECQQEIGAMAREMGYPARGYFFWAAE